MKLIIHTLSLLLIITLSVSNANEFDFKLDGWRGFKFGQDWDSVREIMNKTCESVSKVDPDSFEGENCGKWLGLNVNIFVSSEGYLFNFGQKLKSILIETNFSEEAKTKILNVLKREFELYNDYECFFKKQEYHHCYIGFSNGSVIFEDVKNNRHTIGVSLYSYDRFIDK